MARFTFIGTLDAKTDEASNGYFARSGKTGKGNKYNSINLQVVQEKNNRSFVECFGMESDVIKTMDTNMNKIDIDWGDREDPDVIKDVADFKKTIIKIGDDKHEFISSYDANNFIFDNIDELKGKMVVVTGQRKKNEYKGKLSDRFEFSSIRTIDDDEDVSKKLTVSMELFFNKDSIDTSDWKDEHKLIINGYVEEWIADAKENRFVDQQIILDCSKIDWDNEKHVNAVKFRLGMFNCELDDNNKVVVKLKNKKIYKLGIITSFINGQEEVPFDESMLTDKQKEALELGLKTIDDFKPSGKVYGTRVVIYKLRDFNLRDDSPYKDGCIETDFTQDDFDEKYYAPVEKVTEDDLVKEEKKPASSDDDDDLFG